MKKSFFVFVAIFTGFFSQSFAQLKFISYGCPNEITALAEDGNFIWIGTKSGLYKRHKSGTLVATYNTQNGLIDNCVNCITIDNAGNKWIGTRNGVCKFDNINWTFYNTSNSGLPGNTVNCIAIDSWDNKWIGTNSNGLAKFDNNTWSVFNKTNSGLINNGVFCVTIDGSGRKWIGTLGGVSILAGTQWTHIDTIMGQPVFAVIRIGISPSGVKWISVPGKGIYRYDDVSWTNYNNFNTGGLIQNNYIGDIAFQNNKVWLAAEIAVSVFDGVSWTKYDTADGLVESHPHRIICDGQNNMWIGTNGGISKYTSGSWFSIVSTEGLPSNTVNHVAVDHNNVRWFAAANGLSRFDGTSWWNASSLGFPYIAVYDIDFDHNNHKWLTTQGHGVYMFNDTAFVNYNKGNSGLINNTTSCISFNKADSSLWIGTFGYGVSHFKNNIWTNYDTANSGLSCNGVFEIAFDKTGYIWFATDSGVCRFDGVASWVSYTMQNSMLPSNAVTGITIDTLNNKWISTYDGLARLDASCMTWQVYNSVNSALPDNIVTCISVDTLNNIWAGTMDAGIVKFNGQNWALYNTENGLCSNYITAVNIDPNNIKWFSSGSGVSQAFCENPLPRFVSDIACFPDSSHLENISLKTDATTRYYWDIFNNNTIDYTTPNVTHLFPFYGIYSVKFAAVNDNCASFIIRPDTVSSLPDVIISVLGNTTLCFGDSTLLVADILNYDSIFNYQYHWNNGASTPSILVKNPGNYSLTVTDFNCYDVSDTTQITVNHPYENEKICVVTVDSASGKNLIVWEKTPDVGTEFFNIYKETGAYFYQPIGNVPYNNLSKFLDINSDANIKSDRYKISVVDTCGNESSLSNAHKTMHLTVNLGTGYQHNLIWENYEGFPFGKYFIYRGTTPGNMSLIDSIQSTITTYTDTANIPGTVYYRITIRKQVSCTISGAMKDQTETYNTSVSNMEEYQVLGVNNNGNSTFELSAYPNPFSNSTNIIYTLPEKAHVKLDVYNMLGEVVKEYVDESQDAGNYNYSFSAKQQGYTSGMYYLKLDVNGIVTVKKLIETK